MKIELGDWLPDFPALDNPGCIAAQNVLPRVNSFAPLRNLKSFSSALTGACLGSTWMPDFTGQPFNFAGDATKLYSYTASTATWTNVSRTATYSTATSWNFEKFGDRCIAVSIENNPQYFDMSSSVKFQDVAGSPPKAKYVATVRDFLVLANLESYPNRVRWSGFNNSDLWTSSVATQSDYQDFPGNGGDIQGIVPGAYGVIFQESSIWRMDYQGPPTVFRFDEVERGKGTPAPQSICWFGSDVYFYDWAGFHKFDGQRATPIGYGRVDDWFRRKCADPRTLQGAVDRQNRLIMWGWKSTAAATYNDRILIYHFGLDKWSWAAVETQYIAERRAPALTLDQLDAVLPDGIDLDSIAMDSKAFGYQLALQAFNASGEACTFEGDYLPATVETRELAFDASRGDTNAVMPLVDGWSDTTVRVRFAQRNSQNTTATYSNQISLNRVGEACKVQTGRYQRFQLQITGGFDFVRGVDVRSRKAGRR